MIRSFQTTCYFLCAVFFLVDQAWSSTGETITGLSTQVVFTITIIVSILFGLILTRFAAEKSQAKGRMFATKSRGQGELSPDEVLNELKGLSGSARSQKKAAMAISSLLEQKVDERMTVVKQELTEKYGKLVEEKSKVAAEAQHMVIEELAAIIRMDFPHRKG